MSVEESTRDSKSDSNEWDALRDVVDAARSDVDATSNEAVETFQEKMVREADQAQKNIPDWKQAGRDLGVAEDLLEQWDKMVEIRAGDLYHGVELKCAIDVIKQINNGATAEEIESLLDSQNHSGASYGMAKEIICYFSPRGKQLFENIA